MEPVPASLSPVRSDADFLAQALEASQAAFDRYNDR